MNQTVSNTGGWQGEIYLKAKEDFIGGNAIDTNKQAKITLFQDSVTLETPTVNVHLLDMNENSSEVTVYLGDLINEDGHSPLQSLQDFFDRIALDKVVDESAQVPAGLMNWLDPAADAADGLEYGKMLLHYALGYEDTEGNWVSRKLTQAQWDTLEAGGSLSIPYTYDSDSSHGPVGYFSISLFKDSETYDAHVATEACQPGGVPHTDQCTDPAETYTLSVTYTAYELGQAGRPNGNVHNGSGSPGTPVRVSASGLNNGQGIVTSRNVHEVHVISGRIEITKVFGPGIGWTEGEEFTFLLNREGHEPVSRTVKITSAGTATAVFDKLPRGTYTVTEAEHPDYSVESVTIGPETDCESSQSNPMSATFVMGNDPTGANVIGRSPPEAAYTSYLKEAENLGVFGHATFTNSERVYETDLPVQKVWDDGNDVHLTDQVYLVLYENGNPVTDSDGNARILRLDAAGGWKGSFTITLSGPEDKLENYSYSVREVSAVSTEALNEWHPAKLENDGATLIYYENALDEGGLIGVGSNGYIVHYTAESDGTLTVTNVRGYSLPQTGGMGTHMYTSSGLLLMLTALVYGYSRRRKEERGVSS